MATKSEYVHGYSNREGIRLFDQANTLAELLHHDTTYAAGSMVLEAGCGVGAQTVHLAKRSPQAHFVSMDISPASLQVARASLVQEGLSNVAFALGDLYHLPFAAETFDHVFICFVLEHLTRPLDALEYAKTVLRPAGTITVIEGDHGSARFHPESDCAMRAIRCLIDRQSHMGGDSLIGRRLYPLLRRAGYREVAVTPRLVYVDSSRPTWVNGFTRNTFIAMVEGVKEQALRAGLIDLPTWEQGIADLNATTAEDGVFCYTFFKGVAVK